MLLVARTDKRLSVWRMMCLIKAPEYSIEDSIGLEEMQHAGCTWRRRE